MNIFWGSDYDEDLSIGNAYGYKIHNDTLKKYVSRIATVTRDIDSADVAIYILSPEYFRGKVEGVPTFVFTMFEGTTLPSIYVDSLSRADYILTPSTWVKSLFEKYFPPEKVFVVNHGVEPDFSFVSRKRPHNKQFRYLWVGAPNPRKGWEELLYIWTRLGFFNDPSLELYLKTTRVGNVQRRKNIVVDGRNLTREDLVKLYHDSHCFILPTRGEGFGLTLAEAMRTGLPSIATNYSGLTDFFDSKVGYPIDYSLGDGEITFLGDKLKENTKIAFPNVEEIVANMVWIRDNYKQALKVAEKGSIRIRTRFTWEKSAETLVGVFENILGVAG